MSSCARYSERGAQLGVAEGPAIEGEGQALALGEENAHLLRGEGDAGQWAVAVHFTRRVLLIDKANAFVTHISSLQPTASARSRSARSQPFEAQPMQAPDGSLPAVICFSKRTRRPCPGR